MKRLDGLGIAHYTLKVKVTDNPSGNEDAWATVHVSDTYDNIEIEYATVLLEKDLEEVDAVIVHELCHVPIHRIMRAASRVDSNLSLDVKLLWEQELHDAMERTVEQFARVILAEAGQ